MTEDTPDNVKQFTLNLVPPAAAGGTDKELKECLTKGVELFIEIMTKGDTNIQSFLAIVLDETDSPIIIGAGEAMPLKTLGALRATEDEILKGL